MKGYFNIYDMLLMFLMELNFFNLSSRTVFQINVTENPGIRQLWAPVPSKHGMGFPDQVISFHSTSRYTMDFFVFFILIIFDIFQYGKKFYPDIIFSGVKIFFDRDSPGSVHIIGIEYFLVVNKDISKSIQAFAYQIHILFL